MSAEIVNLRTARKAKQRRDAQAHAAENRARFGRTKHERQSGRAKEELAARRLDGLRRDDTGSGEEPGA